MNWRKGLWFIFFASIIFFIAYFFALILIVFTKRPIFFEIAYIMKNFFLIIILSIISVGLSIMLWCESNIPRILAPLMSGIAGGIIASSIIQIITGSFIDNMAGVRENLVMKKDFIVLISSLIIITFGYLIIARERYLKVSRYQL